MKKIKVLHIVHNFLRGGIESFVYYTVKQQLLNPELEVGILCCASKEEVINHRIESLDVPIYYAGSKSFEYRLSVLNKIVRICDQYDVVHFQVFIPSICIYVQANSKAKVIHTGHSAGSILRDSSLIQSIKDKLFISCLNRADGIAHNSPFTKDYWAKRGVKERESNISIYNGVNFNCSPITDEPYQSIPELKDKFVIGTTSRLISWKRADILVSAFAKAYPMLPDNAVLLIVGEGPELDRLKTMASTTACADRIIFAGYKPNVADYQSIMDICVFPSAEEPFGLVSIECMHLGKRVLVMSDGGGFVDIVGGFDKNLVAESFDDLVDKIIMFSKQKTDGRENERIEYSKRFGVEYEESEYFKLYKQALS